MSGDAFVLLGARTPRGKGTARGSLATVSPLSLVTGLLAELSTRGLDHERAPVDDLLLGCATQVGEQGANMARTAALLSGLGEAVPGLTLNRFCASGLEASTLAAARVASGQASLVVAGGVESVSRVPMLSDNGSLYADNAIAARLSSVPMGVAADLVATIEGHGREELDQLALESRQRAWKARDEGAFARSLCPVVADGGQVLLSHDELLDYRPSLADLAALPPAFEEVGRAGSDARALAACRQVSHIRHLHTRGSSPVLADAAALVLIGDHGAASRLGLRPRARLVASLACAGDPVTMLTAGQDAITRLLARQGLRAADIDVFEVGEAFASPTLRLARALSLGPDRLNPNGGTLALGHAFGATGAALLLAAVDELERRSARRAVVAISGAAGLGVAALLERVA